MGLRVSLESCASPCVYNCLKDFWNEILGASVPVKLQEASGITAAEQVLEKNQASTTLGNGLDVSNSALEDVGELFFIQGVR